MKRRKPNFHGTEATLHGVRVLDCGGSGSISDVIAGMRWVADNHVLMHPDEDAVASMSLGGGNSPSLMAEAQYLFESGVTLVVAADERVKLLRAQAAVARARAHRAGRVAASFGAVPEPAQGW